MRNGLEHHARLTVLLLDPNDSISQSEMDSIRQKILYHITIVDHRGQIVADSPLRYKNLCIIRARRNTLFFRGLHTILTKNVTPSP